MCLGLNLLLANFYFLCPIFSSFFFLYVFWINWNLLWLHLIYLDELLGTILCFIISIVALRLIIYILDLSQSTLKWNYTTWYIVLTPYNSTLLFFPSWLFDFCTIVIHFTFTCVMNPTLYYCYFCLHSYLLKRFQ